MLLKNRISRITTLDSHTDPKTLKRSQGVRTLDCLIPFPLTIPLLSHEQNFSGFQLHQNKNKNKKLLCTFLDCVIILTVSGYMYNYQEQETEKSPWNGLVLIKDLLALSEFLNYCGPWSKMNICLSSLVCCFLFLVISTSVQGESPILSRSVLQRYVFENAPKHWQNYIVGLAQSVLKTILQPKQYQNICQRLTLFHLFHSCILAKTSQFTNLSDLVGGQIILKKRMSFVQCCNG